MLRSPLNLCRRTFALLSGILLISTATFAFSNVTLQSEDGDIEVLVYLPVGLKPDEEPYYVSSRFDHGSMIGSIKLKSRRVLEKKAVETIHELFGAKNWRIPHNSQWPESGIGRKLSDECSIPSEWRLL